MNILVCVKQVPAGVARPRIADSGDRIREDGLSYKVNEADLYALEEAIHQRSVHGGTVTAITVGPARAKEALQVAYAKGVDRALHVVDEVWKGNSPAVAARAVQAMLASLAWDMIFAGIQSDDDLSGRFGLVLAEALGIPAVTGAVEVRAEAGRRLATVTRELGEGFKQEMEVRLPCLLTIQFGIRPLPFLPVMALVKAKRRKIETVALEGLGVRPDEAAAADRARVLELFYPQDGGRCEMLPGGPPEAAAGLVKRLMGQGVL